MSDTPQGSGGMSFAAATEALLSPGGMFEMEKADVLGEELSVFKNRAQSLRVLLEMSAGHGDKEYYCLLYTSPSPRDRG